MKLNKCFFILLLLSITLLILSSSCTLKPSEDQLAKDIREGQIKKASKRFAQPKYQIFKFITIKKDNALSPSKNHYKIEFSGIVESTESFYCSTLEGITLDEPYDNFNYYQKGKQISYKGTARYGLTENGWRFTGWSFAPDCTRYN